MNHFHALKEKLERLRLYHLKQSMESIIHKAQIDKITYLELVNIIVDHEIENRDKRDFERRFKSAHLPVKYDLDSYDFNFSSGITKYQLAQLRELVWIEGAYNMILMGPSGTGKTFIASGLIYEAIKKGYKAYMMTMEEIITLIRLKDISASAMTKYNKLVRAHLVAVDDIMLFPVKKEDSTGFFNFINTLHEKTSIIITTNKAPTEWVETLNDEVLTTALLDRILYKCEVVKLQGASYRIENRKTIF